MPQKRTAGTNDLNVGVAWFDRAQWTRLTEVAPDRSALDDTFEQWEKGARTTLENLKAQGLRVKEVPIDVEQLLAWCLLQGLVPDSKSRADYVVHLLKRESREV